MPASADLQLHSSTANLTDRKLIDEANAAQKADINAATGSLQDRIAQGLSLYNQPGSQDQFNQAFEKAQELINSPDYQAGNVDLSNYNPYMNMGSLAANELSALSGLAYATPKEGAMAGYDAEGRLILAPGGVDVRPGMSSADVYARYLNNPAVQAQMDLGNRQINANAAAKGMLGSGAILKSLQSYGQGIAAQGLGQAQQNLFNLAQLGSQSANQYASSLLNKYSTDTQAALASKQNQTNLIGQQANLLGTQQQGQASQLGFLQSLATTQANIQAQAAQQRQSSLAGAAAKYQDVYGMGYGGTRSSVNTQYNFS